MEALFDICGLTYVLHIGSNNQFRNTNLWIFSISLNQLDFIWRKTNKATLVKVLVLNIVAQKLLISHIGLQLKINDCNLI